MSYFDEHAAEWDSNPTRVELARQVSLAIRKAVPLDKTWKALDYGCGTGLVSFALAGLLGEITLADSSAGMLAVLGEKLKASGLRHLRAVNLDLTGGLATAERFNLVFSSMVLHHVPDTSLLLQNFRKLLAPGGWLAVADLDAEDGTFHEAGLEVHHGFNRERLADLVRAAGFARVAFGEDNRIVKFSGEKQREYSVFLLTARRSSAD